MKYGVEPTERGKVLSWPMIPFQPLAHVFFPRYCIWPMALVGGRANTQFDSHFCTAPVI